MKSKLIIIFFLNLLFLFQMTYGQINTEAMRKKNLQKGFAGEFSLGVGYQSGNTNIIDIGIGLRADYYMERYHFFTIINYKHGEEDKQKYENKGFIHLRGLRNLTEKWMAELFFQEEFNEFLRLAERSLIGTGIRLKALNQKSVGDSTNLNLYLGVGCMWERERYREKVEPNANLIRSTNYLNLRWKFNKRALFYLISYYQVAVEKFSDYRILSESGLSFKLFKNVDFKTQINYRYDNEPPPQVKRYDLEVSNGITINF